MKGTHMDQDRDEYAPDRVDEPTEADQDTISASDGHEDPADALQANDEQ